MCHYEYVGMQILEALLEQRDLTELQTQEALTVRTS